MTRKALVLLVFLLLVMMPGSVYASPGPEKKGASALWVGKMRTKKESHVLISNTDTFLAEQSI